MNGHPTMRAGCPHTHQDTLGAGGGGWLSWGEGDNPVLASPGERSAETAQGKCWGQVGCLAACFPPWCGDAEPSAGGGNAIKRPGGGWFGGDVLAGSSLSGHRRGSTGFSFFTANLPAALPAAPGPVPAQNKPQGKQVHGQERQQVRLALSPSRPHAPFPCISAASAAAPLAPRASEGRRHQGSRRTRQKSHPEIGEEGPPFRGWLCSSGPGYLIISSYLLGLLFAPFLEHLWQLLQQLLPYSSELLQGHEPSACPCLGEHRCVQVRWEGALISTEGPSFGGSSSTRMHFSQSSGYLLRGAVAC